MIVDSACTRNLCWFNRKPSSSMSVHFLRIEQRRLWTLFDRMATIPTQQITSLCFCAGEPPAFRSRQA